MESGITEFMKISELDKLGIYTCKKIIIHCTAYNKHNTISTCYNKGVQKAKQCRNAPVDYL